MFQRIALAAIVIAFATPAIAPVPAGAYQAQHYFDKVLLTNHTNECAWITVYTASPFSAWSIVNTNPQNRPQWLKPHEAKGFYFYESAEVKVRAEVKQQSGLQWIYDHRHLRHPQESDVRETDAVRGPLPERKQIQSLVSLTTAPL